VLVECKGTNEKWLAYNTDACTVNSTCETGMHIGDRNFTESNYKQIFGVGLLICFTLFVWNGIIEEWRREDEQ